MIARTTLWSMAAGAGLGVANNYYAQPLLADMGRYFGEPDRRMGLIPTLSQVGYAAGLLLFVPLGDRVERRGLVVGMLGAVTVALLGVALAPGFGSLAAASLAVGVTTIAPQLLVPFAAHLAAPEERGRVVGTVMSGLLIGVLAARTFSGLVGSAFGWRAVYGTAAGLMVLLAVAMRRQLPRSEPEAAGVSYPALLVSLGGLVRDEPVLRESCLFGAASFGAFSAFWTTLAFHLAAPPFSYPAHVIGLFGLVGVAGALAAPLAGRLADRGSPRLTIGLGLLGLLLAFGLFAATGRTLGGLVAGVVLLDLAAQACHISNQSRIFAVRPEARSRMNTVYMVAYFVGGSAGSLAAVYGWGAAGWGGVCLVGAGFSALGLLAFALTSRARRPPGEPTVPAPVS